MFRLIARPSGFRLAAVGLVVLFVMVPGKLVPAEEKPAEKLLRIEKEIETHEKVKRGLEDTGERLSREVDTLTAELIETAATIQAQEDLVSSLEQRLTYLDETERGKTQALEERTRQLAHSLAALQRLSQQPNLVLIGRPATTVDGLRSVSLITAVVPELQSRAKVLGAAIVSLEALREEVATESRRLVEETETLTHDRSRIDELLKQKAGEKTKIAKASAAEQGRLEQLGRQALDLRALIARLEGEARRRERRGDLAALPDGGRPFSSVRGSLALPARGRLVRVFNQPDDSGQVSKGILIQTRLGAQVVAPYDGRIVFAGAFRNYGQVLIIAHGEGYHTVLAGVSRIDGVVGQWLLTGEPVGQMTTDDGRGFAGADPALYVELRRNGEPINPMTWLAVSERKVGG